MPELFSVQARPRIAIVAGEVSGDLLGSHLIAALKRQYPFAEFIGIAGPKMQAEGCLSLFPMEKLAVRGYVEVLKHLPEILSIRRQLKRQLLAAKPDIFIGVDAPDFNLDLECRLKKAGIKVVHYVSPSVWAWRRERVKKIGESCDLVLTLFPFEKPIYDEAGIAAAYVGHPLADEIPLHIDRDELREQMRLPLAGTVFALLPGSRQSELQYMAEPFIKTAQLLAQRFPACQFLVPLITRETRSYFESEIYRLGAQELDIRLLFGHAQEAIVAADAVLVASGTASLETALLKRPMVIAYKLSPLTYKLVKRKMLLPWVGLPNVLAGRFLAPELLQDEATPENLAQALGNYIDDKALGRVLQAEFEQQHRMLRQNTAERAAAAIAPLLAART